MANTESEKKVYSFQVLASREYCLFSLYGMPCLLNLLVSYIKLYHILYTFEYIFDTEASSISFSLYIEPSMPKITIILNFYLLNI